MSEEIKAVVFDVGNVLFHWDLRPLFEKVIPDPARLEHFLGEVLTLERHFRVDAGADAADLAADLVERHPGYEDAFEAYLHRYNETILGPVAGTHAIVERLAARGVPLFALTNFGTHFWNGFRPTAPIFDLFGDIVVSGEEELAKPDPAIFKLAESRFGYAPGELFFTDDSPRNVEEARTCGWQAHLFTDAASLEAELAERGLLG